MSILADKIQAYFKTRGLTEPTLQESLNWAQTEMGEVYEVIMSWDTRWVRNNPQNHPVKTPEDLAEELGDVIMMLVKAGLSVGVDPLSSLEKKMEKKLKATLTVRMEPSSPEEFEND